MAAYIAETATYVRVVLVFGRSDHWNDSIDKLIVQSVAEIAMTKPVAGVA